MTNLLPLQRKRGVTKMYRLRLISVSLLVLSGVAVVAITLLLPSFFIIQTEKADIEQRLASISVVKENTTETDDAIFKESQELLVILSDGVGSFQTSSYVHQMLLTHRTSAISLTRFSYDLQKGDEKYIGKIAVNGTAQDRNSLEVFVESLNHDPLFDNIEDPISNYINETNLPFSLLINIVKHEE